MKAKKHFIVAAISIFIFIQVKAQYPTTWTSKGLGGGGAIYNPSISPFDSLTMYLSCDMSDMFKTSDFGKHWSMIDSKTFACHRNTCVQFTSDANILYANRNNLTNSQMIPNKSTDGGNTWTQMNPPSSGWGAYGTFQLYAHPKLNNRIIASGYSKIFYSKDGGTSWQQAYSTSATKGLHLAGVYFQGDSIFVASNEGVILCYNAGATTPTWSSVLAITGIAASEEMVCFRGCKTGNAVKFICITMTASAVKPQVFANAADSFKNVYTVNYFTQSSWQSIKANLPNTSDKVWTIAVVANDTATWYLGGTSYNNSQRYGNVFKTTNGGRTFALTFLTNFSAWGAAYNNNVATGWRGYSSDPNYQFNWIASGNTNSLAVDPNNINRIIRTDMYVAHVSTNGGATWTQAYADPADQHSSGGNITMSDDYNTSGLETTVCYWMTWLDQQNMFAGVADVCSFRSKNGGSTWTYDWYGLLNGAQKINDVSQIMKHSNGKLYAAEGDIPGSNGNYTDARLAIGGGVIAQSSDNGQTWSTLWNTQHPVLSIATNPNNTSQCYAAVADVINGAGGIYYCSDITNSGSTWIKKSVPGRTEGRASQILVLNDGGLIAAYGGRDAGNGNGNFTRSSGVFYSNDGGATWMDSLKNDFSMTYFCNSVTIDPSDPLQNTWFASVSRRGNKGVGGVYRTIDRGATWTNIFSSQSVFSNTFHPDTASNPNEMYVSTEFDGLIYLHMTNTSAPIIDTLSEFPFRCVQRVFFNPYNVNEVWVMTFGNGMRMGTLVSSNTPRPGLSGLHGVHLIPNPVIHVLKLNAEIVSNDQEGIVRIFNLLGQQLYSKKSIIINHQLDENISVDDLENGYYLISFEAAGERFCEKFLKQ